MKMIWTILGAFLAFAASGFAVAYALTTIASQRRRVWLAQGPPFPPLQELPDAWSIVLPIAVCALAGALFSGVIYVKFVSQP